MPITAGSIMLRAAAHLNDPMQLWFNSAMLLPFLNMALERLEEELGAHEISAFKKSSIVIQVASGNTELTQMPIDYVEAYALYEKGGDNSWVEVGEVADIDKNITSSSTVVQWAMRNTKILINPVTSNREVLIDYIATIIPATNDSTAIDIFSARRFLALETARGAARDLGSNSNKANQLEPDIRKSLDNIITRLQKADQGNLGVRRLPYRGRDN